MRNRLLQITAIALAAFASSPSLASASDASVRAALSANFGPMVDAELAGRDESDRLAAVEHPTAAQGRAWVRPYEKLRKLTLEATRAITVEQADTPPYEQLRATRIRALVHLRAFAIAEKETVRGQLAYRAARPGSAARRKARRQNLSAFRRADRAYKLWSDEKFRLEQQLNAL